MSIVIRDPMSGLGATVDQQGSHGRLEVSSRSADRIHYAAREGDAYTWTAISADIDTGDTALYVVNDSTTKGLYITKIYMWADVPAQFKIHCPAYVLPAGGQVVVGVNMNRTAGAAAQATSRADETGNVFAAANVITTLHTNELTTDIRGQWVDYGGALILGYHDSVAVDIIGESAAFECTIMGYFHND